MLFRPWNSYIKMISVKNVGDDIRNQMKKNPFGKPQAEVDFACVYNL